MNFTEAVNYKESNPLDDVYFLIKDVLKDEHSKIYLIIDEERVSCFYEGHGHRDVGISEIREEYHIEKFVDTSFDNLEESSFSNYMKAANVVKPYIKKDISNSYKYNVSLAKGIYQACVFLGFEKLPDKDDSSKD